MKRFIVKAIIMLIPILSVIFYYVVAIKPHRNGDLGWLGFMAFDDEYNSLMKELVIDSLCYVNVDDLNRVDCDSAILTIGDSFSQLKSGGYQNCLSTLYPDWKIYNYYNPEEADGDKYQHFIDMLMADSPLPQIVILESVERHLSSRLANMKFYTYSPDTVKTQYSENVGISIEKVTEDNKWQFSLYKHLREEKEELKKNCLNTQEFLKKYLDIDNPVKHLRLDGEFFTCKGAEDDLFFYQDDLITVENDVYLLAYQKLDSLLSLTERKGIQFVFLVPSDKYDLYKDFTIDDKYDVEGQLSYYGKYNSNINFLNSKELLYPHLIQGEKDIYKCNDTHWSPLASYYVANELKRRLDIQIHEVCQ